MLNIGTGTRIFVCREATDMRRSFEGLCGMVRQVIQGDPVSGHLFLFLSRNRSAVRILFWDRTGFVIWYKKLERGTLTLPEHGEIDRGELMCVLEGLDSKTFFKKKRFFLQKEAA
jgi:transposase